MNLGITYQSLAKLNNNNIVTVVLVNYSKKKLKPYEQSTCKSVRILHVREFSIIYVYTCYYYVL